MGGDMGRCDVFLERGELLLKVLYARSEPRKVALSVFGLALRAFAVIHAGKESRERVIIALRNGVELVRMTTSAAHGESQEGGPGRRDHVVQFVGTLLGGQPDIGAFNDVHRPTHEKTGGDIGSEGIARELLANELVIGFVLVEGGNDVVSNPPGVWTFARLVS